MSTLNVGDENVVEYILEQATDTNKQDIKGYTALHYSAYKSNPEIITSLLKHGVDPSIKNTKGLMPVKNVQ